MSSFTGTRTGARAAAFAMLLCSTAMPAFAQDVAPAADAEADIIVTGQRAAERRSVERKRDANVVQDSVAGTEVGRLPDQNVAEAVRRLPGVTVANDQGEGRYVVIRGTDPNLANVTINGQTAPAPEPEGRQVKLDDIPSSLIGSVDVIKTLTADRDANAIAGQVDINTLSAFDRTGSFLYARGAYGLSDLNGRNPWEVDATAGTRFGDLGVVVSGNYSRRPIESQNFQGSSNWRNVGGFIVPDDFRLRDYNLTRTRYGGVANFDYRPSNALSLYARFLYSVFNDNETRDHTRIEIPTTITGQTATTGTFSGRGTVFVSRRIENDSTFTANLGGTFGAPGDFQVAVAGTYSRAIKTDPLRSEFSFRTGSTAITGNVYDLTDPLFIVNRGPQAFLPATYAGYRVNYDRRRAVEELYQGRIDFTLPIGLGDDSAFQFGLKYIQRDKSNNRDFEQYNLSGATNLLTSGAAITTPLYLYDGRYNFGPRINYDLAQAYYTVTNPGARTFDAAASVGNSLVNDYIVNETIYAGYAMATLRLGDLTIIPGVRVEHTDGDFQAKTITAASTAAQGFNVAGGRNYTDVFPSVNVRYDATDAIVLRGAVTTAIGRPNYSQLAPYVQVDVGANTVSLGNANLRPLKAVNADLSFEWYLPGRGVFAVAGFYKHISDPIFVGGFTQSGTYGGVALTNAAITQPINADTAEIYGVEFNLQLPFSFLPAPFSGFGVNLNYTRTGGESSGIPIPGRTQNARNYLQSRDVASAQVYYEYGPLAVRFAYSYRSAYLDAVGATPALDQYTAGHDQLDARFSFALQPQAVLFIEGSNLTDSPWRRYLGNPRQVIENERYSYTVRAGLQLAF